MNFILPIWRNAPSIIAIALPILIEFYYRKLDAKNERIREEERKHNDRKLRIQWTLEAYTKLYDTALYNLENFGTGKEISDLNLKRTDKEYKLLRSYIDRIDTFAKGFGLKGGQVIYDMETFMQISSPYFKFFVKPRVNAFLEKFISSEDTYENTKMLLERVITQETCAGDQEGLDVPSTEIHK